MPLKGLKPEAGHIVVGSVQGKAGTYGHSLSVSTNHGQSRRKAYCAATAGVGTHNEPTTSFSIPVQSI